MLGPGRLDFYIYLSMLFTIVTLKYELWSVFQLNLNFVSNKIIKQNYVDLFSSVDESNSSLVNSTP